MNLPTVETIKYDLPIDELKQKIKYRPFTVKEHKLLLQAIELKDEASLINTVVDLVDACTFKKLDLQKLPQHIVDFLYIKIHAKSTGATQKASYRCNAPILQEDETVKPCGGNFQINLSLEQAAIVYPENYTASRNIQIDDKIGIRLKVPSFEDFKKIKLDTAVLDITDEFIYTCIECIYDDKGAIFTPGVDFTPEEFHSWIDDIDGSVLTEMGAFFTDLPYVGMSIPVTCPKCGKKEVIELKGLEDFFE